MLSLNSASRFGRPAGRFYAFGNTQELIRLLSIVGNEVNRTLTRCHGLRTTTQFAQQDGATPPPP